MFSTKLIPILLTALRCVKGDCFTRSCQKISLDVYRDAIQGLQFVDHVFHNSVTVNPAQCYTWCIQDCRCLSFNFKENNEEKYCELNEGNHLTNESSLKNSSGTKYYSLRRKYEAKVKNSSLELTCLCWTTHLSPLIFWNITVYFYNNVYILYSGWKSKRKQERANMINFSGKKNEFRLKNLLCFILF